MDQRLGAMDQRFVAVDQRFVAMDGRVESLEQEVRGLRGEILGHFDELYRRIERLEQEHVAITGALRRIEALLVDERARQEIVERDVATLKENLAVLRARIDEIERRLGSP
jgi:chromosome segregation ATPase